MANLAAANMMHRKTRTLVSVLAVAVEVAMVMVLVGLANGTIDDIAGRLENVGADVLFQPPDASLILGATSAVMPTRLVDLMKREVPGVRAATGVLNWHISRLAGAAGDTRAINLWAIDYPSFATISGGLDFVRGRAPGGPQEVVIDTLLAQTTGLSVGDAVSMMGREFRVAGVFRSGAGGRIYARLEDVQEAIGTPGKVSFFLVKGEESRLAEQLAGALQKRFAGYKITPVAQVSQAMRRSTVGLQEFKRAVTGMAVMISFLVVLLAMYTAIIERTREIGILRAIGATRAKVVKLIVTESLFICLAGTLLGVLVAVGIKELLLYAFPTQVVQLTVQWALLASALGIAGGILGSFYPALRAARLDPIHALNFE